LSRFIIISLSCRDDCPNREIFCTDRVAECPRLFSLFTLIIICRRRGGYEEQDHPVISQ
jgi:hypothetical protein